MVGNAIVGRWTFGGHDGWGERLISPPRDQVTSRLRADCAIVAERREYKTEQASAQFPSLRFSSPIQCVPPPLYLPGPADFPVDLNTQLTRSNPASILGSSGSSVDIIGLGGHQIF